MVRNPLWLNSSSVQVANCSRRDCEGLERGVSSKRRSGRASGDGAATEVRDFSLAPGRSSTEVTLPLPVAGRWWISVDGPGLFAQPTLAIVPMEPNRTSVGCALS